MKLSLFQFVALVTIFVILFFNPYYVTLLFNTISKFTKANKKLK